MRLGEYMRNKAWVLCGRTAPRWCAGYWGLAAWGVVSAFGGSSGGGALLSYRTRDGFTIVAELRLPPGSRAGGSPRGVGERGRGGVGAPLVVLAHELGRDRHSWDPLVPRLLRAGYAVLALDHRGFGESRGEASSPAELSEEARANLHRDIVEGIEAAGAHAGVDAGRVAIVGSGLSVTPAVRAAAESPQVRALVLLTGLIEMSEERFLLEHPQMPLLLVAAAGDARGVYLMRQYAARLTGPAQRYVEIEPPDPTEAGAWRGTEGLREDTGLADLILWFLGKTFPAEGG